MAHESAPSNPALGYHPAEFERISLAKVAKLIVQFSRVGSWPGILKKVGVLAFLSRVSTKAGQAHPGNLKKVGVLAIPGNPRWPKLLN